MSPAKRRARSTTAPRGRPAGANGEDTRERVILAAMRSVAEMGYSQASIREIARAADMTSGSLYHYFPTKAELLTATVATIEQIAFPRLRSAAEGATDVVERLEAVLDAADDLITEYPYLAAFERAIRADAAAYLRGGHAATADLGALREIITDVISDAERDGALAPGVAPAGAVDAIYALTRGLTEQAATLPRDEYHRALQAAKQLIRGTLLGGPAPTSRRTR